MDCIRSTLYLDKDVHKALKIRTAMLETSMSRFINKMVRRVIKEDAQDLKVFKQREYEKETSLATFITELKEDGLL